MRWLEVIGFLSLLIVLSLLMVWPKDALPHTLADVCRDVEWRQETAAMLVLISGKKTKTYDSRGRRTGDIYDPGHGRRLQIRDKSRVILGYIERSGKITDKRRRKIGTLK